MQGLVIMSVDKIYSNIHNQPPKDLHRTVPVQPTPRTAAVDIPGVLDQTRRLYQPYRGPNNKDQT